MQTPNTIEAQLTEKIMKRVRSKLGDSLQTHIYNPIWSAVLETLTDELPKLTGNQRKQMTRKEFIHTLRR